jgi:two-component system, OmpR family, response regulator RegX3
MFKVAVLDDDPNDRNVLIAMLKSGGHEVAEFETSQSLLRALRTDSFDALIVDWNLPDLPGVEVIGRVRTELLLDLPIIMLTARDADFETVEALKAGADDYITKPAQCDVLLARLEAVSRRQGVSTLQNGMHRVGSFEIDVSRRLISRQGEAMQLTEREFKLALALFRHLGRAVSRDYLHSSIWGHNVALESRTLDVHISRVRSKLGLNPESGWRLATVYGYGYRLETMPS